MSYTEDIKFVHKHLTGQPDSVDDNEFIAWKDSKTKNAILADQIEGIWEASANAIPLDFDVDKAFQNHLTKLSKEVKVDTLAIEKEPKIIQFNQAKKENVFNLIWVRSLVGLLILSIAVLVVFELDITKMPVTSASVITLEDGSRVWLDSGSELDLNSFSPNNRLVKLKGKGYFDITSNKNAPFRINADGFDVQVLGTKFVVNAVSKEVLVKDGKVKVFTAKENVILVNNQKVVIDESETFIVENSAFDDSILWFNEELKFNNTPFDQVVKDLSSNFNVKFTLPSNNDWSKCTFTSGSLKGNSLDQVLIILKLTYDLEYARMKDNSINLTKVKCK